MKTKGKWKSYVAMTTIFFFFCTFVLGCATRKAEYREVRRDQGKVTEYYLTASGKQVDSKIVEDALRAGDIKTLTEVSSIFRPLAKEQIRPEEYIAGEITFEQGYSEEGGSKRYINVGANPQNMPIPPGWWPIGLPREAYLTVKSGKDGKKEVSGLLKKGEMVWVYVVIKDGQPIIDSRKGILLQLGAVKRCGNKVVSDIKLWYPLPLLRQAVQKQTEVLVLQKVIDRGQATVYMEQEEDNSKYWIIGLLAIAAVGAYFIGRNQAKTDAAPAAECKTCRKTPSRPTTVSPTTVSPRPTTVPPTTIPPTTVPPPPTTVPCSPNYNSPAGRPGP